MKVDPTGNMAVFVLARGEGEHAIADAPTRAEDGIRQAWERAPREHRARPDAHRRIGSPYPDTELVLSMPLVDAPGIQLVAERG